MVRVIFGTLLILINYLPLSGVASAQEVIPEGSVAVEEVEDSAARAARLKREYEAMTDPSRHHAMPVKSHEVEPSDEGSLSPLSERPQRERSSGVSTKSFGLILVIVGVLSLVNLIAFWILLERGGHPGFGIIIPIYNVVLLSRLAGFSGWWALALFVPVVGPLIWGVTVHYNIAKHFDRSSLFALGAVFLPFIFFPIMAFSRE